MLQKIKKNFFLYLLFTFLVNQSFSQEKNWSEKQIKLLEKHQISKNDHRGVIFISNDCSNNEIIKSTDYSIKSNNEYDAINTFLNTNKFQDLTYIFVEKMKDESLCGKTLDIWEVTNFYLQQYSISNE